ncbi:MAG: alpha/beta hydrolase, partial [Candidatus Omnitrophota bacterium]
MQHNEETFKTTDCLDIFAQWWRPGAEPKAVVVIVHGYAEHSSRYTHVAEYLIRHGYAVYAFDLRGHGRSEGTRAFVRSFDDYLADLACFLTRVNKREQGKPIFLLGHSMGGTIVTLFAVTRQSDVRGLILSGTLLKTPEDISSLSLYFSRIASYIFPKLPVIKKVDSRLISRDPRVVARYENDPLVYRGNMLAGEAAQINRAINLIRIRMESISLPLLILHGTADGLVDVEGSKELYNRAGSADKTLKLYESFYHEVLNEPDKERVL